MAEHFLVGLHGPKGSGKDTFAELARELLAPWLASGALLSRRFAFGDELKAVIRILTGLGVEEVECLKRDEGKTLSGGWFRLPSGDPDDTRIVRASRRLCERYGDTGALGGESRVGMKMAVFLDEFRRLPEGSQTVRRLLQMFGTEFGRERLARDIWVRIAINDYLAWLEAARCSGRGTVAFFADVRMENEAVALKGLRVRSGVFCKMIEIRAGGVVVPPDHVSEAGGFSRLMDLSLENDPGSGLAAYRDEVARILREIGFPVGARRLLRARVWGGSGSAPQRDLDADCRPVSQDPG